MFLILDVFSKDRYSKSFLFLVPKKKKYKQSRLFLSFETHQKSKKLQNNVLVLSVEITLKMHVQPVNMSSLKYQRNTAVESTCYCWYSDIFFRLMKSFLKSLIFISFLRCNKYSCYGYRNGFKSNSFHIVLNYY